jgi:hypothetical protein
MKKIIEYAGSAVVIVWLVMLGMLVQRSCRAPSAVKPPGTAEQQSFEASEEWSGIYFKDTKAGYAHSLRQKTGTGYSFREYAVMELVMLDVPQRIISDLTAETDHNLLLRTFSCSITSGIITFRASGSVYGRTARVTVTSGGNEQVKDVQLSEVPMLAETMRYAVARSGLTPGTTLRRTIFDPITLSARTITTVVEKVEEITIRGRKQRCFRVKESCNGIVVYAWLDRRGETLKEESPVGFVLIREPRELATKVSGAGRPVDILAATGITIAAPLDAARLTRLRLRLKNVSLDGFELDDARQKRFNDTVEITREKVAPGDSYCIPYSGKNLRQDLEPTAFIQSDNRAVIDAVRSIIGDVRDAQQAVNKIRQWMQSAVEKVPTMSIPSAVEVLRTRRGDCNEHAVLFAALARAAGIPARICAGIVYMSGSFYYHSWNEVYLNRWISIDSTLNQFPCDVTHVTFVRGNLEQQTAILKLVGRIGIEVLESS